MWAPKATRVELVVEPPNASPRSHPLARRPDGYHHGLIDDTPAGTRYRYRLDGGPLRADPASRHQPEGVAGPSEVVDPERFRWTDEDWRGHEQERLVFYELHVGTYTPESTFHALIPHLDRLARLGVTALELMPVAQFPGARNWGYDGVLPYAVQNTYGGPDGLRALVDAAHAARLSVVLDVVYNHLGPEGNHLAEFGPYYVTDVRTPWGAALNFESRGSDDVREYFILNALHWLEEYHLDGLRLDAVHAFHDRTATPFLEELTRRCHERALAYRRPFHVIAESSSNDPRLVTPPERNGLGLDGVWNDDFHHSLHALLTAETTGYYADYGTVAHLAKAYTHGFVLDGQISSYRGRRHGRSSLDIPAARFVVANQTHDQVGNRAQGDRLARLVGFEALKLAAAATILSPNLPLLFMGEEHAEPHPFLYFTDHTDPKLQEAVRRGRKEEFARHAWNVEPPDPGAVSTFNGSRIQHGLHEREPHRTLHAFYTELLRLRRDTPALAALHKRSLHAQAHEDSRVLFARRWHDDDEALLVLHLAPTGATIDLPVPRGRWTPLVDSADPRWRGPRDRARAPIESDGACPLPLSPWSALVLAREGGSR